jgi:uncharacterized protein (TIGR02145 family)/uncharacterized repeat protein (TIGR02543 family)
VATSVTVILTNKITLKGAVSMYKANHGSLARSTARLYAGAVVLAVAMLAGAIWIGCNSGNNPATTLVVTFNTDGGIPARISPVIVDIGGTLGEKYPAAPAKEGYVFGGWFEGAKQYTASTVITKDVNLVAKWNEDDSTTTPVKQFAVTFNTNGGTPATITSVTVDSGSTLGAGYPTDPTKADSIFEGWFDGEEQYTASTIILKDVALIAKWEADEDTTPVSQFVVSFNTSGGTPATIASITVDSGSTLGAKFPADPTKADSIFAGWFDNSEKYTSSTIIVKDVSLVAKWDSTATLTFRLTINLSPAAGGTVTGGGTFERGTNAPVTAKANSGYRFNGWTGAGVADPNSANTTVAMTANRTVVANFVWIQHTLTVNSNPAAGGTVTGGGTFNEGTNATITAMANSDYRFVGWTGDGIASQTSANTTVLMNATKTVTANFEQMAGSFTDSRDSKNYRWVRIGTQVWMAENLNFDASGSQCYRNSPDSCAKYGRLYDWNTVMAGSSSSSSSPSGVRGICPAGWHVPSDAEWEFLVNFVGGESIAGTKLKSKTGWNSGGNGIDDFGFSALPGGNGNGSSFYYAGNSGYWWSATEYDASYAWLRYMYYDDSNVLRYNYYKTRLFALRCALDNAP